MATIVDGKKRIPFMRGMLMHYLIERGFSHEEAHRVANEVRDSLTKSQDVRKKELVRLVEERVAKNYGQREVGDLVFWERLPTSITVERKNGSRPFSKELLSHSLQATGLAPDQAYRLARTIEDRLLDQRRQRLGHQELELLVAELLEEFHDRSYAERYQVWRVRGDLDKPLIILIGGASGVGKTTLAIALASLLDIPRVVATDDIRQIMRLMLSTDLMPALHQSSYNAWTQMPESSIGGQDPVISGYREQARVISVGVKAILSRCVEENASVIIDGVHLLPDFIDVETFSKSALLVPLCLALTDRRTYEERFAERADVAPARPKHKYISNLDEILKIQEHILACCSSRDIPVLETGDSEALASAAVMVVAEQLQEQEDMKKALSRAEKAAANGKKKKG